MSYENVGHTQLGVGKRSLWFSLILCSIDFKGVMYINDYAMSHCIYCTAIVRTGKKNDNERHK